MTNALKIQKQNADVAFIEDYANTPQTKAIATALAIGLRIAAALERIADAYEETHK